MGLRMFKDMSKVTQKIASQNKKPQAQPTNDASQIGAGIAQQTANQVQQNKSLGIFSGLGSLASKVNPMGSQAIRQATSSFKSPNFANLMGTLRNAGQSVQNNLNTKQPQQAVQSQINAPQQSQQQAAQQGQQSQQANQQTQQAPQEAMGQDNSSIDQQIAALQSQIQQLQAQRK